MRLLATYFSLGLLLTSLQTLVAACSLQVIPKSNLPPSTNLTIISPKGRTRRNVYLLRTSHANISIFLPLPAEANGRNDPLKRLYLRRTSFQAFSNVSSPQTITSTSTHTYYLERTSIQANRHNCCWATNGGPYNPDYSPVGTVIADSQLVPTHSSYTASDVGFGKTKNNEWVFGAIASEEQAHKLGVTEFVTGMGWLVYQGRSVFEDDRQGEAGAGTPATGCAAKQMNDRTRAPRTAVGVDRTGQLLVLVADGAEHWLWGQGLSLKELADTMVAAEVVYAVNLDGGGSSVLVQHNGEVISHPTCIDIPLPCERAVSTVLCLPCDDPTADRGHIPEFTEWYPVSGGVPTESRLLQGKPD